jgi:acetyltransferase-like isoleucine patch superfamily enzyme
MVPVDFGTFDDPWQTPEGMTEAPVIHPTAAVKRSRMGAWSDCDIYNADVGKFCNIAAGARINPTNHPMWRANQHHFTYRSRSHQLDAEDDSEIFAWRRADRVTIGPDVRIGHGAIVMPGIIVGVGAVLGAGTVATRDVAAYTIVRRSGARAALALRQKAGGGALADCLVELVQGKARDRAAGFPRSQRRRVRCQI